MGVAIWTVGLFGLAGLLGLALWFRLRRRRGSARDEVVVIADDPNTARVVAEAWLSGGAVIGFVGDDGVLRTRCESDDDEDGLSQGPRKVRKETV